MDNPYMIHAPKSTVGQSLIGIGSILGKARQNREAKAKAEQTQRGFMEAYKSGDPNKVASFVSKNPDSEKLLQNMFQYKDEKTKQNQVETLRSVLANPTPEGMQNAMVDRVKYLESVGADPSTTLKGLDLLGKDPEAFLRNAKMGLSAVDPEGYKAFAKSKAGVEAPRVRSTIFLGDGTMVQSTDSGRRVISPDGREIKGKEAELAIREGRKQKIEDAKVKAGAVAAEKKISTRQQDFIDKGFDAAEGYANLKRGLSLLNEVETGGFDRVSIRAKQIFGIESANEAELSNRLSKAVLSQLRETFGAAFTENEGNRLDRIEAGFGKSTEGNKRLLRQTMKLIERSAKRGVRAAERAGDFETAREIQESLDFTLDVQEGERAEISAPQMQQQPSITATGANGQKLILINNQWVPQ